MNHCPTWARGYTDGTTIRCLEEGARLGAVSESDWSVKAVFDPDGCCSQSVFR